MRERKVGLTLGKFAPLHRGHQFMIETAMAEMDEVIVVIYDCPETTPIPLTVRTGWLRELYPSALVLGAAPIGAAIDAGAAGGNCVRSYRARK